MTMNDRLGRLSAALTLACALPLSGCVTSGVLPDHRCKRWGVALEPRLTISGGLEGVVPPVASLVARPVCLRSEAAS